MHKTVSVRVALPIRGFLNEKDADRLVKTLAAVPGVVSARADFFREAVYLIYDPLRLDLFDIEMAVNLAGFCLPTTELTLAVRGMVRVDQAPDIERSLEHLPGVLLAAVDPARRSARVQYVPEVVTLPQMQQAALQVGVQIG